MLAVCLLSGLVGWNVWYWGIRVQADRPIALETEAFATEVPFASLFARDGIAYGTISRASWVALPDPADRLDSLGGKLARKGIEEVVVSDENARLLASWKKGRAKLY